MTDIAAELEASAAGYNWAHEVIIETGMAPKILDDYPDNPFTIDQMMAHDAWVHGVHDCIYEYMADIQ